MTQIISVIDAYAYPAWIGKCVWQRVVVPLIGVLIRIRHEERTLHTALGAEYDEYAAHTPRLLPGIW